MQSFLLCWCSNTWTFQALGSLQLPEVNEVQNFYSLKLLFNGICFRTWSWQLNSTKSQYMWHLTTSSSLPFMGWPLHIWATWYQTVFHNYPTGSAKDIIYFNAETIAYLRVQLTSFENGISHVYILMTCIPEMISFISRTRSSVLIAVFSRYSDVFFPRKPANNWP